MSMNPTLWRSLIICSAFVPSLVTAQVKVLGFELNSSSAQHIRSTVGQHSKVHNEGVNAYSGGPQFRTDGTGYGMTGLSEVTYIFDRGQRLAAVVMDMDKDRFDEVFDMLASKYKVNVKRRPFVGDRFAEFKPKGSTIQLIAPHLSFQMQAMYLRNDFYQAVNLKNAQEAQQKRATEMSKF